MKESRKQEGLRDGNEGKEGEHQPEARILFGKEMSRKYNTADEEEVFGKGCQEYVTICGSGKDGNCRFAHGHPSNVTIKSPILRYCEILEVLMEIMLIEMSSFEDRAYRLQKQHR